MSELILGASAPSFTDTLSVSGLETLINAALASLLTNNILSVSFTATDQVRNNGTDLITTVTYDQGGTTITHPYLVKGFVAQTVGDLVTQILAYMAANPGYFFGPVYTQQLISPRRQKQVYALMPYNTDFTDGQANWFAGGNSSQGGGGGGGSPTGPAGGDLGGSYPNPDVFVGELSATPGATTTTLDSAAIAAFKTVVWEFEAIKGTNTYSSLISASHDGTTPVWVEDNIVLAPSAGTFDVTAAVAISGGNLNLDITTASGGWTIRARRVSELSA